MITGIFLNSFVIISFAKSFQLRHKVCYFMILVLSSFDLTVIIINHPFLIYLRILFSVQIFDQRNVEFTKYQERIIVSLEWVMSSIVVCSTLALLTLNVERFLALRYPYFHHSAVTRRRLISFLLILIIVLLVPPILYHQPDALAHVFAVLIFWLVCFPLICQNYKMACIVKSLQNKDINTSKALATKENQQGKKRKKNS